MTSCSLCAVTLSAGACSCPRCGISSRAACLAPPRPPASRPARLVGALGLLAVAGAIAWPAAFGGRAATSCEPQGWVGWHAAMRQSCLTPEYVCANMTPAKLLSDPETADAYQAAISAGDRPALAQVYALVAHLRAAYGCGELSGSADATPAAPGLQLPPGHPPIPQAEPQLPPGHPPIPSGHPPIPSGHPPIPSGPPTPIFQAPDVLTI